MPYMGRTDPTPKPAGQPPRGKPNPRPEPKKPIFADWAMI
ncbi:hypothetical protein SAMN04490248_10338 [Salinihabitans flavidus]|uniref:Uncharacterized protein n=1 Tax=Salinihabitans flavidus TaxID=569882 RepID=A0A1H8N6W6_9RHOB|nr:hypothetical protein SAMN04490248_10338 [Salinihabitans flavidus]